MVIGTEVPTLDMFGTLPRQSRGIMKAAEKGEIVATEGLLSGIQDASIWERHGLIVDLCSAQWRMRGVGAVRVHHVRALAPAVPGL